MDDPGHPVQIITIVTKDKRGTSHLHVDKEAIHKIVDPVKHLKIAVISIAGRSRGGKSFLMSILQQSLQRLSKGNLEYWEDVFKLQDLGSFIFSNSVERFTVGFWMWSKAFILPQKDGSEDIAVLLMDTQGLFDKNTTREDWFKIMGMTLFTSSCTLYNMVGNVQEDSLYMLENFLERAKRVEIQLGGGSSSPPGQNLTFVVRDWQLVNRYPVGSHGGQEFLERLFAPKESMPADLIRIRESIQSYFEKIACYLMPNPGKFVYTKGFQLLSLPFEFLVAAETFVGDMISPDRLVCLKRNGKEINGEEFMRLVMDTAEALDGKGRKKLHQKPATDWQTKFTFESCLGSGVSGIVFEIQEVNDNRSFALKLIQNTEDISLQREVNVTRSLSPHPNVVQLLDVTQVKFSREELMDLLPESILPQRLGSFFRYDLHENCFDLVLIQMELCGKTLRAWLEDAGTSRMDSSLLQASQYMIARDLTEGLKYLHRNQVIHRDVKPENAMFSLSSKSYTFPVKLGDFGFCRQVASEASISTMMMSSYVGTPLYMAPEVSLRATYGLQSDIFSLGLVVWEVIELMKAGDRLENFTSLVHDDRRDLVHEHPLLAGIKRNIELMTMKNAKERMRSLEDFTVTFNASVAT